MITYAQAQAMTGFFISGVTDPAFDGSYNRDGPPNGSSASFYHSKWPDGAPHQAHFTIAAQGRPMASGFEHFHISVECDGTNWKFVDVIALQGFTKISGVLVTTVFHAEYGESVSYPGVAAEVEEDHSMAFQQLLGR